MPERMWPPRHACKHQKARRVASLHVLEQIDLLLCTTGFKFGFGHTHRRIPALLALVYSGGHRSIALSCAFTAFASFGSAAGSTPGALGKGRARRKRKGKGKDAEGFHSKLLWNVEAEQRPLSKFSCNAVQ